MSPSILSVLLISRSAATRDFLATVGLDGEMGNFTSEFAIPVSPPFRLTDLAEHTESLQVFAAEVFLIQEAPTFPVGDVSEALEAVGRG